MRNFVAPAPRPQGGVHQATPLPYQRMHLFTLRLTVGLALLIPAAAFRAAPRPVCMRTFATHPRTPAPILSSAFELIEQRQFGALVARAREDPSTLLQLVKDAGVAGAVSYTAVELTFFAIALPVGYFSWHASTGEWLQPLLLLQEDGVEGKAR